MPSQNSSGLRCWERRWDGVVGQEGSYTDVLSKYVSNNHPDEWFSDAECIFRVFFIARCWFRSWTAIKVSRVKIIIYWVDPLFYGILVRAPIVESCVANHVQRSPNWSRISEKHQFENNYRPVLFLNAYRSLYSRQSTSKKITPGRLYSLRASTLIPFHNLDEQFRGLRNCRSSNYILKQPIHSKYTKWQRKVLPQLALHEVDYTNKILTAKSRTMTVRLISMAMTGFYRTMVRPRTHRPLSMLKYDPVVRKKVLFLEATKGGKAKWYLDCAILTDWSRARGVCEYMIR